MTGQDAVSALLDRVRDWWRRQGELSVLGNMEIGRVAEDLRISTVTLLGTSWRAGQRLPTCSMNACRP